MSLLPHQKKAVEKVEEVLKERGVCLLDGQTRSGKTRPGLAVGLARGGATLFITKKVAIPGVKSELEEMGGGDVTVINKESLHKVEQRFWSLVVVDECHDGISGFPTTSKAWKAIKGHIDKSGAKVLLMSGTAAMESGAQLFHEFALSGHRSPWRKYRDFYAWWRHPGHYKDGRACGGYGIKGAVKDVGNFKPKWAKDESDEVTDYSQVNEKRIAKDLKGFVVKMTREDAGHKVLNAKLIPYKLRNPLISGLIKRLRKDKVVELGGKTYAYDKGPAQVMQACHMIAGGTIPDGNGGADILPYEFDPLYRIRWIAQGMKREKTYVVLSNYVKERDFLAQELESMGCAVYGCPDELKRAGRGVFVGSLVGMAEGVDFHWITGTQILYSLTMRGAKFSQVCDRQLNWKREEPARVTVPLLSGSLDSYIFNMVKKKENFTSKDFFKVKLGND